MGQESRTERDRVADLVTALTALPFCDAVHSATLTADGTVVPKSADAVVQCMWAGRRLQLLLLTRTNIYPRDAREIIWRMDALTADRPGAVPNARRRRHLDHRKGSAPRQASCLPRCRREPFRVHRARLCPHRPARTTPHRQPRAEPFSGHPSPSRSLPAARTKHLVRCHSTRRPGGCPPPARPRSSSATLEEHEWVLTRGRGPTKQRRVADAGRLLDAWAPKQ